MFYWLKYLQYFAYLAWHWNLRLAFFVIYHEIKGERKYKVQTVGIDTLKKSVHANDLVHANVYQPVNFHIAEKLFSTLTDADKQTAFVDVGCGKGRVLAMAAYHGFAQVYGFDIAAPMCTASQLLATQLETKFPDCFIQIDCKNADDYVIPTDAGVLFLFNPFDHIIMETFAKNVMKSLQEKPRQIKVLYANPVCKNIWLQHGFVETFHFKKLGLIEGSVFTFLPK
jgi:SAM-dependent methyltransferase